MWKRKQTTPPIAKNVTRTSRQQRYNAIPSLFCPILCHPTRVSINRKETRNEQQKNCKETAYNSLNSIRVSHFCPFGFIEFHSTTTLTNRGQNFVFCFLAYDDDDDDCLNITAAPPLASKLLMQCFCLYFFKHLNMFSKWIPRFVIYTLMVAEGSQHKHTQNLRDGTL